MTAGGDGRQLTLGERLARQVQDLAARRLAAVTWLPAFEPLLGRAMSLPTAAGSPLRRVEADVWDDAEPPPAERLPGDLREWLHPLVGPDADRVRLRRDERADEIARAHEADAVTVGEEIFFRTGRFRPAEPEGAALLVHEATHVVEAVRPGSAWRRATASTLAAEEALAHEREQGLLARALGHGAAPAGVAPGPGAADRGAARPATSPLSPPHDVGPRPNAGAPRTPPPASSPAAPTGPAMAAPEGRELGVRGPTGEAAQPDLETLRHALYRDLLLQIRTDAERGA